MRNRELFEFRRFLDEVRMAATSELVSDYRGHGPQDEPPDPADLHEDIRETLGPFFDQIRYRIEGPPCPHTIPTSLNTSWRCILPAGHDGPHLDGRPLTATSATRDSGALQSSDPSSLGEGEAAE